MVLVAKSQVLFNEVKMKEFVDNNFFVLIFLTSSFIIGSKGAIEDEAIFLHWGVTSVVKSGVAQDREFFLQFQTRKLCLAAKRTLSLFYLDEDYEPQVQKYVFTFVNGGHPSEFDAIYCPTLPAIYLSFSPTISEVIAMSVRFLTYNFNIVRERNLPELIQLERYKPQATEMHLIQLDHETRQNLCIEARKHAIFLFVDNYVPEARTYEFVYRNKSKFYNAIPCPTFPATYLRDGESRNKIVLSFSSPSRDIVIVRNVRVSLRQEDQNEMEQEVEGRSELNEQPQRLGAMKIAEDNYRLVRKTIRKLLSSLNEADREKLCILALTRLPDRVTKPQIIAEPKFLEFDYGNGIRREHFAICCSLNDDLYVYFENFSADMKIVLLKYKLLEYSPRYENRSL